MERLTTPMLKENTEQSLKKQKGKHGSVSSVDLWMQNIVRSPNEQRKEYAESANPYSGTIYCRGHRKKLGVPKAGNGLERNNDPRIVESDRNP